MLSQNVQNIIAGAVEQDRDLPDVASLLIHAAKELVFPFSDIKIVEDYLRIVDKIIESNKIKADKSDFIIEHAFDLQQKLLKCLKRDSAIKAEKIKMAQFYESLASGIDRNIHMAIHYLEKAISLYDKKRDRKEVLRLRKQICLLKLSEDLWLLTTIKRVVEEFNVQNKVNYRGEELPEYRALFGRVIIRFHKTFMTQGRYYREIMNDLVVNQILPDQYDGDNFPGYDNVRLSYWQLSAIINKAKQDWVAALRSQKAVYLITDKNTGKLYVGSATSDNGMLLQRWTAYVKNGHGGNKELMALVEKLGFEYVKSYFQYSILENYNQKVEDKVILERESWWKETLQSRKWGYNAN